MVGLETPHKSKVNENATKNKERKVKRIMLGGHITLNSPENKHFKCNWGHWSTHTLQ